MSVVAGACSDAGRVRPRNEDRYLVLTSPKVAAGLDAALAVADGMGGHQAGEIASGIAVDEVAARFGVDGPDADARVSAHGDLERLTEQLAGMMARVDQQVRRRAARDPACRGMGTTLTLAVVSRGALCLGHVGDSRAYLIRDGQVQVLTRDQTWVEDQRRAERLTSEEAAVHPRRNELTQAIGGDDGIRPDVAAFEVQAGDHLVLCSDGLSSLVTDAELGDVVTRYGQPAVAAEELVRLANARDASDNVTAVVARVLDDETGRARSRSDTQRLVLPRVRRGRWSRRSLAWLVLVLLCVIVGGLAYWVGGDHELGFPGVDFPLGSVIRDFVGGQ